MKKIFSIILVIIFFSCERGHVQEHNSNSPEISINLKAGEDYNNGDTVLLKAAFKDSIELHGVSIEVSDISNGSKVISIGEHRHLRSLSIDTFFVIPGDLSIKKYRVYLKATNHADKASFKEVLVESNP